MIGINTLASALILVLCPWQKQAIKNGVDNGTCFRLGLESEKGIFRIRNGFDFDQFEEFYEGRTMPNCEGFACKFNDKANQTPSPIAIHPRKHVILWPGLLEMYASLSLWPELCR